MTKLTKAVMDYKKTYDEKFLIVIIHEIEGIVEKCINSYSIRTTVPSIRDEIARDCKTFILLRAIKSFRKNRGTEFSTHFYWKLRNFLRIENTKLYRQKRIGRLFTRSIQEVTSKNNANGIAKGTLLDAIPSSPTAIKTRARTQIELHKMLNM